MRITVILLFILMWSSQSLAVTKLVASKEVPKPPPIQVQKAPENNKKALSNDFIVIQKKVTQLERKLLKQKDTQAIVDLKSEVRKLKRNITKLRTRIATNEEINSLELINIKSQIKEMNTSTYIFIGISLLVIILIGFLVILKAKQGINKMIDKSHVENERKLLLKLKKAITTTDKNITKQETPQ